MANVRMQIGLEVIRSYRRLDYTPWYALAEFIDNSTQSYRNNRHDLDKVYKKTGESLRVTINYDRDAGILIVRDNAMGMSLDDLQRALHIGLPPVDATGLSQFGLGLKTAACWFGNKWSVRTKKLGDTHSHSIEVNVEEVASGNDDLLYKRAKTDKSEHYTEIRIEDLHVVLKGRRLAPLCHPLAA